MRIVGLLSLYFYIIDSFLVPHPPNIFKTITKIHNNRMSFLQSNAEFLLNVTRRVKQRRYEILSLIFEDTRNFTQTNCNASEDMKLFSGAQSKENTALSSENIHNDDSESLRSSIPLETIITKLDDYYSKNESCGCNL